MKTKAILVSLITLLIISCKNKVNHSNSIIDQETQKTMIPIKTLEEIKQHIEFQKRVDSEEESFSPSYRMTGRDLELASIVMFEGLKNNGFRPVSDEVFNERIKEIFGIDNLKKNSL